VKGNEREQAVARVPSAKEINAWIKQALKIVSRMQR
jgi:hypothetical protein